ncbi:ABC-three component system middle component 1 [Halobacillus litoralis]|uniref:ABC-three component system middle component 1 n=1 Tax=Halobacillus litoralis TaxID=45668 RepID=UPI0024908F3D|nr:ABC-three component system middle component 1 [Halobacillus litoralis]
MEFSQIKEWLRKYNFTVVYSEKFYPEYFFCKREQINVIVKEYDIDEISNEVRSDAVDLRTVLNKLGENIWNTYLFVCNKNRGNDISYSIEKDSIGLRKYIINSEDDFKRIPFLDKDHANKNSDDTFIKLPEIEDSLTFKELVESIISNDGLQRELKNNEVKNILAELYEMDVVKGEN